MRSKERTIRRVKRKNMGRETKRIYSITMSKE